MTAKKKPKKTVRAWALAWSANGMREFGVSNSKRIITDPMKCTEFKESAGTFEVFDIFPSRQDADAFLIGSGGDFVIIPCRITYELPAHK